MEFSRQDEGEPFLSPEDLPDPGIEPGTPELQVDSLLSEPPGKPSLPEGPCEMSSLLPIPAQRHQ